MTDLPITLPEPVWAAVRAALVYQRDRLDRKSARTNGEHTLRHDRDRIGRLDEAIEAIGEALR